MRPAARGTLCLTFDNMGRARDIAEGRAAAPDAAEPGLAIGYPRLLGLLDELGLRGTFFIEGWNALHHPERIEAPARRQRGARPHRAAAEGLPRARRRARQAHDSAAAGAGVSLRQQHRRG
jgi:peptidoglycan/xylan/chitin deacetylase (PgdA/CDA1 family)